MIKTIIFDFGDVFINLDKSATQREFERRKIFNFSEKLLRINEEFEVGKLSSQEFIKCIRAQHGHLSDVDITTSWNAILMDFPQYRLDFVKKLAEKKNYKLILLSNTNELHIEWVKKNVPFYNEFKNCFDAFYLSQEINLRKPEPTIYQFVLREHHLDPQEVLFIDDTKGNTEAASRLGIQTWNIDPSAEDVVDLFSIKKELF